MTILPPYNYDLRGALGGDRAEGFSKMYSKFFSNEPAFSAVVGRVLLVAAALFTIAAPLPSQAGPLMLPGHGADDHGFETVYAGLFDELLANVTNGSSGILAIGADPGTTAGNWIVSVASQMTVPQTVTFVNDAAITAQDFSTFASTSDFTGANSDANAEIFLWTQKGSPAISQPFLSGGCANDAPSIDSRGRFVVFHSSCNLIPSSGNPDQSIFVWDNKAGALLPLVVRGPMSSASARPQATKKVRVLTFEGNLRSVDPAICFLNARDELLEILSP